jgi:hypothetical protein
MAKGKLVADEIEHSSVGSVDTQFVVRGSAKALSSWANSADTNQLLDGSDLNTSSATDGGIGIFTINYTNNFIRSGKYNYGTSFHITTIDMCVYGVASRSTSSDTYGAIDGTGPTDSYVDHARNLMTVFGDLA